MKLQIFAARARVDLFFYWYKLAESFPYRICSKEPETTQHIILENTETNPLNNKIKKLLQDRHIQFTLFIMEIFKDKIFLILVTIWYVMHSVLSILKGVLHVIKVNNQ